jgi:hypothetical protein
VRDYIKIIQKSTDWRISTDSCGRLATTINNTIKEEYPNTVVLNLLDSIIFYTRSSDGSRILPKKETDGNYHVNGNLVLDWRLLPGCKAHGK